MDVDVPVQNKSFKIMVDYDFKVPYYAESDNCKLPLKATIDSFNFIFIDMECLLCHFQSNVSDLKNHYRNYNLIDPNIEHFLNLSVPDYLEDDKCFECLVRFHNSRKKKNHMFLVHYNQKGGART